MRLVILTHGRKELMLSMVALIESTGKYKDPEPDRNQTTDGIQLMAGSRSIHAYNASSLSSYSIDDTTIVDALKDSIETIWKAVNDFASKAPIVMDFQIQDGRTGRTVIVHPRGRVEVGCSTVTKEQMEKIIAAWNKQ